MKSLNLRTTLIMLLLLTVAIWLMSRDKDSGVREIMFSEFIGAVIKGEVKPPVIIRGLEIYGELKNGRKFLTRKEDGREISQELERHKVAYRVEAVADNSFWNMLLIGVLPLAIMAIFFFVILRRGIKNMDGGAMDFRNAKTKRLDTKNQRKVTFADVAGIDEVKEDVVEVVEYLRGKDTFSELGGRIPKGILLIGPSGVGKTLLARAIAGEAGVSFLSISGSEFVEMFVGVGAARVRSLFEQARRESPCIVFVDEIDAMGRQRGTGLGGGHDEREQTLNQLLVEMDGFEENSGIILVAATNRPDILDPAFVRPGRFDRKIYVPRPDINGRLAILKVHGRNKKFDKAVDLAVIARVTIGATGADLENMLNEAALIAGRRGKKAIDMNDLEYAGERVAMGRERRSLKVSDRDKRVVAVHESGHAILSLLCPGAEPLRKVSIVPRNEALGVTMTLPEDDRYLMSKVQIMSYVLVFLGGRAAEEICYGQEGVTDRKSVV